MGAGAAKHFIFLRGWGRGGVGGEPPARGFHVSEFSTLVFLLVRVSHVRNVFITFTGQPYFIFGVDPIFIEPCSDIVHRSLECSNLTACSATTWCSLANQSGSIAKSATVVAGSVGTILTQDGSGQRCSRQLTASGRRSVPSSLESLASRVVA